MCVSAFCPARNSPADPPPKLLRIKCEAYATLNDQDEDTDAEARLHQRMAGVALPRPALVAPAALYLTAVLECVCEYVIPPARISFPC